MVEWRPLIIGIIFALSIYVISSYIYGQTGGFLAFLLGGVAVGYMIGGDLKEGAIHGAVLGLITALIPTIILVIEVASSGLGSAIMGAVAQQLLIIIVIQLVIAVIGGALGTVMKEESYKPQIQD
jgi:hypothetical protein